MCKASCRLKNIQDFNCFNSQCRNWLKSCSRGQNIQSHWKGEENEQKQMPFCLPLTIFRCPRSSWNFLLMESFSHLYRIYLCPKPISVLTLRVVGIFQKQLGFFLLLREPTLHSTAVGKWLYQELFPILRAQFYSGFQC